MNQNTNEALQAPQSDEISAAEAARLKVEQGGSDASELAGRWWWTVIQPGWSGVD